MTEPVPWQQLTHAEIYAAVHAGPGPGVSQPAEDAWAQIEEVVRFAERHLSAAISRSAGSWEGSTAEAARSGFTALNSWALDAAGDAQLTVAAVRAQAEQVLHVRNEMPPAMTPEQLLEADAAAGREPDNPTAQQNLAASHGAEPRARDLMTAYGANTLGNARKLDYWTVPPTITVEVAGTAGAGTGTPVAGGPGTGGPAVGGAGAGRPAAAGAGVGPGPLSAPGPVVGTGAGGGAGGLPLGGAGGLPVGGAGGLPGGAVAGGGAGGPAGRAGPGVGAAGTGSGSGVTPAPDGPGLPGSTVGGPGPGGLAAGRPGAGAAGGRGTGGTGGGGPGAGRPGAAGPGALRGPGAAAGGGSAVPPVRTFPPGSPAGALPPGAGGRGVRPPEAGPPAPRPSGTPAPTWRDLVQREAARAGEPPATRHAEPGSRPAAEPRTAPAGRAPDPARTGAAHGLYPPMAGAAGPQGGERLRPAYLVDDSGVFDVTVDCAEPVIRGTAPPT